MAQSKEETVLDEAKSLLVQGKRFMALEDYQSATDCLEQSCQLFDAFYGVAKRECADAYLEYGLALVALANQEAGSGTDKLMKKAGIEDADEEEGEEAEDEEEDEGEEAEDDDDAHGEEGLINGETVKPDEDQKAEENGTSNTNGEVPMDTAANDSATNGVSENRPTTSAAGDEPVAGTSSGNAVAGTSTGFANEANEEDVENEEATTIEIAWEVLCLAKRLYMTDESLDGRMKLAETLQKIGEISIEWDNNDNAVSILEECLNIRKAILPPEDRLIALTYYNLGLAHSFKSDIASANDSFQNAIDVIEKRIEMLNKDLDKAKQEQDTVVVSAYQKEISELKELLPDMTMRLDDTKEDAAKSTEVLKRTREELQQEDEEVKKVCLDTSKPVDDISHLVKRKTN